MRYFPLDYINDIGCIAHAGQAISLTCKHYDSFLTSWNHSQTGPLSFAYPNTFQDGARGMHSGAVGDFWYIYQLASLLLLQNTWEKDGGGGGRERESLRLQFITAARTSGGRSLGVCSQKAERWLVLSWLSLFVWPKFQQPMDQCCPHPGWVLLSQLNLSRNGLTQGLKFGS